MTSLAESFLTMADGCQADPKEVVEAAGLVVLAIIQAASEMSPSADPHEGLEAFITDLQSLALDMWS